MVAFVLVYYYDNVLLNVCQNMYHRSNREQAVKALSDSVASAKMGEVIAIGMVVFTLCA